MSTPRKSWYQQEQAEKAYILKRFWDERVKLTTEAKTNESLQNLKNYFLRSQPPLGQSIEEWTKKLDNEWKDGSAFASKENFYKYFEHISSVKTVGYAENLMPEYKYDIKPVQVSPNDIADIAEYVKDKDVSIISAIGSVHDGISTYCTANQSTNDILPTQSITKVFTGVLALRLLEEGIISVENFTSPPFQISDETRQTLQEFGKTKILEQLEGVTLHQMLTHHAGIGVGEGVAMGDYYGEYLKATELATANNSPYPEITSVNSFLQFVPNQTCAYGDTHFRYSNSGIILGALSLVHLYNQHQLQHPEKGLENLDFDGLLKKYVTGPENANMSCFEKSPDGLAIQFNPEDTLSQHMVATPGGGYYSTAEDLVKFATWLSNKCQNSNFTQLIEKYGQEICPHPESKTIEHTGDGPFNSGFFSLNWETGNVVVTLNNQRANAASEVGRQIKENILLRASEKPKSQLGSTAMIAAVTGDPTPITTTNAGSGLTRVNDTNQEPPKREITPDFRKEGGQEVDVPSQHKTFGKK